MKGADRAINQKRQVFADKRTKRNKTRGAQKRNAIGDLDWKREQRVRAF